MFVTTATEYILMGWFLFSGKYGLIFNVNHMKCQVLFSLISNKSTTILLCSFSLRDTFKGILAVDFSFVLLFDL